MSEIFGTVEGGTAEVGTAEVGTVEGGSPEVSTAEVGTVEVDTTEVGTDEASAEFGIENGIGEVGSNETDDWRLWFILSRIGSRIKETDRRPLRSGSNPCSAVSVRACASIATS